MNPCMQPSQHEELDAEQLEAYVKERFGQRGADNAFAGVEGAGEGAPAGAKTGRSLCSRIFCPSELNGEKEFLSCMRLPAVRAEFPLHALVSTRCCLS